MYVRLVDTSFKYVAPELGAYCYKIAEMLRK